MEEFLYLRSLFQGQLEGGNSKNGEIEMFEDSF